ncbi:MAG TPA: acyl-CoA dehydrogenase family protein [Deltaproteobacteria bacterium]|nr:acyl-CoA dehydrogenase family protein [Deltaproteobacteria bacterium]
MDFELSEEMRMLADMAYKFAVKEIEPIAAEADEQEHYTPEVRKKAGANGLIGSWIPEAYGGAGVGFLGNTIITEQLSRICMGIGLNIVAATFGCENLLYYGTEEQKKTYMPPVCAGDTVCAGAYTEPNAGTDVAGYKTRAVADGDDFVLTGNKIFITNGTVCDWMVVQAITDPEEKVHKSFSQFIVPADSPGIVRTKIKGKLGIRASDTAEIALDGVRVPKTNLVGKRGAGFYQLMHFFDTTRVLVAAQGIGLSQACLDESVKYCKERTVFGKVLGTYQITMQKLTEMWIRIEALRNMTYKAAVSLDGGKPDYHLSAMAKYFAGQTAVFCANLAVELHGGYGYVEEYKVQKWYRDAKILELYEGTKEAEVMTLGKVLMSR